MYFDIETKRISEWDARNARLTGSRTQYLWTGETPNEKPKFVKPEFFTIFDKLIRQAYLDFVKTAKNPFYIVKVDFDELGQLVWVFGREDKKHLDNPNDTRNRAYEFVIDAIGAAAFYDRGDGTLIDHVITQLKQVDEKQGE